MRVAVWIVCGFAALWGVALILMTGLPTPWIAAPVLVSVALAAAFLILPARPSEGVRSPEDARRGWRAVGVWAAIEVVALIVAGNVLIGRGLARAVMPVSVIIVGAHFLGMARHIPFPIYYGTGAALIVLGGLSLVLPGPMGVAVATGGAAVALWTTAIVLIQRQTHWRGRS